MILHDSSQPGLLISVALGVDTADAPPPLEPGTVAWLRVYADAEAAAQGAAQAAVDAGLYAVAQVALAGGLTAPAGPAAGGPSWAAFTDLAQALDWLDAQVFRPQSLALRHDLVATKVAGLCWQLES